MILFRRIQLLLLTKRFVQRRTPFGKRTRDFNEKNRLALNRYPGLRLAKPIDNKPDQFEFLKQESQVGEPKIVDSSKDMLPLYEQNPPYHRYTDEDIAKIENFGTFYDPLFNPLLHEERERVNPDEEPFKAIYAENESTEFTKTRNIYSPELWSHIEALARIRVPPKPRFRKPNEPIKPTPSGYYPPPEQYPDLPYSVSRTRNYLLPIYYHLSDDEEKCCTFVSKISGDIWQFENDIRTYLEQLKPSYVRLITSVKEPESTVMFRGKHLKEIADYLHQAGF